MYERDALCAQLTAKRCQSVKSLFSACNAPHLLFGVKSIIFDKRVNHGLFGKVLQVSAGRRMNGVGCRVTLLMEIIEQARSSPC
jgi:hypothetical protein